MKSHKSAKGIQQRCVYFLEAGEFVKVGVSNITQLGNRIKTLRTGCPYRVRVLGYIENRGLDLEERIHATLYKHRAHGEWFHKTPRVMAVVQRFIRIQDKQDAAGLRAALE